MISVGDRIWYTGDAIPKPKAIKGFVGTILYIDDKCCFFRVGQPNQSAISLGLTVQEIVIGVSTADVEPFLEDVKVEPSPYNPNKGSWT